MSTGGALIRAALAAEPWAITPEALEQIVAIATRTHEAWSPEALSAKRGMPLDERARVTVRDGVATVPIRGPMMRYANLFTEISGATSLETMAKELTAAAERTDVRAILLDIDSPGGQVNGTSEFAELVRHTAERMPTVAVVTGLGASAAYWVASAAREVVAVDTATLGSLGAVLSVTTRPGDDSAIEFVSSQTPAKRLRPDEESGRAALQQMVDAYAEVFLAAVARYRDRDPATIASAYGAGAVFVGKEAVARGLADRLGTYEAVHAALVRGMSPGRAFPTGRMTASSTGVPMSKQTDQPAPLSAAAVAEQHPEAAAALRAEGAVAENARIRAITARALPGHEPLVAACVADLACSADAAAARILEAELAARASAPPAPAAPAPTGSLLDKLEQDARAVTPPAAAGPSGDQAAAPGSAARVLAVMGTLRGRRPTPTATV